MQTLIDQDEDRRGPVTDIRRTSTRSPTVVTAEYDVTAERAWRLWADPRPPSAGGARPPTLRPWSSTTSDPAGTVHYYMTGPEGDQPHGGWEVLAVDPLRRSRGCATTSPTPTASKLEGHADGRMVVDIALTAGRRASS